MIYSASVVLGHHLGGLVRRAVVAMDVLAAVVVVSAVTCGVRPTLYANMSAQTVRVISKHTGMARAMTEVNKGGV